MAKAAGEDRRFRKKAELRTASIKRRVKEPRVRYKPQTVVRLLERRDSTTAQRREKPQTVTSMRQRMAKPTPTLGAVGSRREEVRRTVLPLPRAGGAGKEQRIISLQRKQRRGVANQVGPRSGDGDQKG